MKVVEFVFNVNWTIIRTIEGRRVRGGSSNMKIITGTTYNIFSLVFRIAKQLVHMSLFFKSHLRYGELVTSTQCL